MPAPTAISVAQLARLLGRPDCPALVDVRTDEDYAADPRLIPGAVRRSWSDVPSWADAFVAQGKPAIVICNKGLKLSEGVAAWLRHAGAAADNLEGGMIAWQQPCG
jgi:rhodanese-related sulfurtransferase